MEPVELVTLEEAKEHLRATDADDAWLTLWIVIVSQAIASWLKDPVRVYLPQLDENGSPIEDSAGEWVPLEDSNGPVLNPLARGACLIELASQYRYREGEGNNDMAYGGRSFDGRGHGYILNKASTALLTAIRRPTVA